MKTVGGFYIGEKGSKNAKTQLKPAFRRVVGGGGGVWGARSSTTGFTGKSNENRGIRATTFLSETRSVRTHFQNCGVFGMPIKPTDGVLARAAGVAI